MIQLIGAVLFLVVIIIAASLAEYIRDRQHQCLLRYLEHHWSELDCQHQQVLLDLAKAAIVLGQLPDITSATLLPIMRELSDSGWLRPIKPGQRRPRYTFRHPIVLEFLQSKLGHS